MTIIYEILQKMRTLIGRFLIIVMTAIILIFYTECAYTKQYSYLGIDFAYMHADLQQGFGKDLFSTKQMPQWNLFVGHYFMQWLGFEIGYAQTKTMQDAVFVPAMASQFGLQYFTAFASNMYATSKTIRGFNFNYVPQVKLAKVISIIPVLGIAYLQAKMNLSLTQFDGLPASNIQQANYALSFSACKLVPSLGIRLQFMLLNFGVRASYIWEQTSQLQAQATRNINTSQILIAKLHNASTVGVGVLYKF